LVQSGQITTEKAGPNRPDGELRVQRALKEVLRDSLRLPARREVQKEALEVPREVQEVPREVQEVPREEVLDLVLAVKSTKVTVC